MRRFFDANGWQGGDIDATASSPAVVLSSSLLAVGSQVFVGTPGSVRCRVNIDLHPSGNECDRAAAEKYLNDAHVKAGITNLVAGLLQARPADPARWLTQCTARIYGKDPAHQDRKRKRTTTTTSATNTSTTATTSRSTQTLAQVQDQGQVQQVQVQAQEQVQQVQVQVQQKQRNPGGKSAAKIRRERLQRCAVKKSREQGQASKDSRKRKRGKEGKGNKQGKANGKGKRQRFGHNKFSHRR